MLPPCHIIPFDVCNTDLETHIPPLSRLPMQCTREDGAGTRQVLRRLGAEIGNRVTIETRTISTYPCVIGARVFSTLASLGFVTVYPQGDPRAVVSRGQGATLSGAKLEGLRTLIVTKCPGERRTMK